MPNDPIQAIEFAQSKGQARKDGRTNVSFADVAGCDEAVRELKFVVEVSKKSPYSHVSGAAQIIPILGGEHIGLLGCRHTRHQHLGNLGMMCFARKVSEEHCHMILMLTHSVNAVSQGPSHVHLHRRKATKGHPARGCSRHR